MLEPSTKDIIHQLREADFDSLGKLRITNINRLHRQLYRSGFPGAVRMDLSKAFDNINYGLLIAYLHAYGFEKNALDLVYNFLRNRKQRMKINTTFSTWTDLISDVSQRSVLGPPSTFQYKFK